MRRLNDTICIENGYSIVENPKRHGKSYNKWLGDKKKPSHRERICAAIDDALAQKPESFDALLELLRQAGYEIKGKKVPSLLGGEQQKSIRMDTLGAGYTPEDLRTVISGEKEHTPRKRRTETAAPEKRGGNLLVDIQAKLQEGKGAGYARWATLFNLKQMAQTVAYLQDHQLLDYSVLSEKAAAASTRFNELSAKIKTAEARMAEIAVMRTHIINYAKTRDTYDDSSADGLFAQEKYRLLEGTHISGHQNGIIVNSYLANTNGLSLGDTLTFKAGTGEIASGEIIGIFFSGMESKQDDAVMAAYRIENQVYVNHELYEKMFPGNGYSSVSVYTSDPDSLSVLYEQASALVDNTITISTSDSLYQQMQAPLKQVIRITTLMLILIIITAVIVISLLLCMWMRTRTKEMAVLISLGFSKWNLFLQAITESLFLFVVSVIGATATNYLFSKSIMNIIFASTDYASLSQTHLTLQHFLTLLFVGGLIVLITVGISIYPTLRANPRDTLSRMEG